MHPNQTIDGSSLRHPPLGSEIATDALTRPRDYSKLSAILVERDGEVDRLGALIQQPGAIAIVHGEAGAGKSRLIREGLALANDRPVLVGQFKADLGFSVWDPIVQMLSAVDLTGLDLNPLAGALRALIPEKSSDLPPALEPLSDSAAEMLRIFRGVTHVLDAAGPACVVLEDLHWADKSGLRFASHLAEEMTSKGSLVLTCRSESLAEARAGLSRHGVTEIEARALSQSGVQQLIASLLGSPSVSEEFAQRAWEKTAGLPFAVEEVLKLLIERRDLVKENGLWSRRLLDRIETPEGIEGFISERMARMSSKTVALVRAVSVLGTETTEALALRVADLEGTESAEAVEEALGTTILQETDGGGLRLRHDLARQAVYDSMPARVRRLMHERAALALEAEKGAVGQIALHFGAAGQIDKALPFARQAARLATSRYDHNGAYRLLESVLTHSKLNKSHWEAVLEFGDAGVCAYEMARPIEVIQRYIDQPQESAEVLGRLHLLLARLLALAGQPVSAERHLQKSLPLLEQLPALRISALSHLALPWMPGTLAEGAAYLDRASEIAIGLRDEALKFKVDVDRATLLLGAGDPRGWSFASRILDGSDRGTYMERNRGQINIADACLWLGYAALARAYCDEFRLSPGLKDERWILHVSSAEFLCDYYLGHWDGLEGRAANFLQAHPDSGLQVEARMPIALLKLSRGHGAEVQKELHELAAGDEVPSVGVSVSAYAALARLCLERGKVTEALEHSETGLDFANSKGLLVWAGEVAVAHADGLIRSDRRNDAEATLALLERELEGRDAPVAMASAHFIRALLHIAESDLGSAQSELSRALGILKVLRMPWRLGAAQVTAASHVAELDRDRAAELLLSAEAIFRNLGATWDASRATNELRKLGRTPLGAKRGRKGYGNSLSPRELEVVKLAGQGASNKEIAAALFISPKTVEIHLARGLAKLGVTRGDLVDAGPQSLLGRRLRLPQSPGAPSPWAEVDPFGTPGHAGTTPTIHK